MDFEWKLGKVFIEFHSIKATWQPLDHSSLRKSLCGANVITPVIIAFLSLSLSLTLTLMLSLLLSLSLSLSFYLSHFLVLPLNWPLADCACMYVCACLCAFNCTFSNFEPRCVWLWFGCACVCVCAFDWLLTFNRKIDVMQLVLQLNRLMIAQQQREKQQQRVRQAKRAL